MNRKWDFQNIRQSSYDQGFLTLISFSWENADFDLYIYQRDDKVSSPSHITHEKYKERDLCPACKEKPSHQACEELTKHVHEIFYTLIEHPSLRLKWLFIPHVENEETDTI